MDETGRFDNPDTVSAELMTRLIPLRDVALDGKSGSVIWLEGRDDRSVLVHQSPDSAGRYDLTRGLDVRARVGYGGGDFSVADGTLYFISGHSLYRQSLEAPEPQLVLPYSLPLSSPAPSPDGHWLALIAGSEKKDQLVLVPSEGGKATILWDQSDFLMQPAWHSDGRRLCWVAWNHPDMPWSRSEIHVAEVAFTAEGLPHLESHSLIEQPERAFFQPRFSPDGNYLSYVSDEGDWFNLKIVDADTFEPIRLLEDPAEHGRPAWVQGMRTYGWRSDGGGIYYLRSRRGFSSLCYYDLESDETFRLGGCIEKYTQLSQICTTGGSTGIAVLASAPDIAPQVVRLEEKDGRKVDAEIVQKSLREDLPGEPPRIIEFTAGNVPCHGLLWKPGETSGHASRLPTIIKIHGGPTSQYSAEFELDNLFFTSRGYQVLALNYRGSSGHGRSFRDLLRETWGVFDVEDVEHARKKLLDEHGADPDRIVLMGGSAGGYTLLRTLIQYPGAYRAGICRYGVTDLLALTQETHKFERHYLDWLIGPLPEEERRYRERSPLESVEQIQDPLAIFQGTDDKVVPPEQSRAVARSLEARRIPHHYREFEGEGHGWRKPETIRAYYREVEDFLETQLHS